LKKIDLGQIVTLLANLGVIAGIIFLGVELRQNNKLMEAEARNARNLRIIEVAQDVYTSPGLSELFVKAGSGAELSEAEEYRIYVFNLRRLRGMEAQYREFQEGNLSAVELNVSGLRAGFHGGDFNIPMDGAWERIKPTLSSAFVEFMEENVVNER
jgi:hypothetical protein